MSFDESFLAELLEALAEAGLQAVVIGNTAAALHGVPILTQDVDLMVRDHPKLEAKLKRFAEIFGVSLIRPYESTSKMIRAVGRPINVDFVLALSSGKSYESIRSRAHRIRIGKRAAQVADLKDVIESKEATGRPKDRATLEVLRNTLRIKKEMKNKKK